MKTSQGYQKQPPSGVLVNKKNNINQGELLNNLITWTLLSEGKFAKMVGVDRMSIHNWKKKEKLSPGNIARLTQATGIDKAYWEGNSELPKESFNVMREGNSNYGKDIEQLESLKIENEKLIREIKTLNEKNSELKDRIISLHEELRLANLAALNYR